MKNSRILIVILCIALLLSCVSLVACNSDTDQEKEPPVDNSDKSNDNKDKEPAPEPTNKLQGKTVIWNGDSICQGSTTHGTWAGRIAEKNELKAWKNYGVGGGTITENVLYQDGRVRHSVSATLEQMHEEFPDADYVILEGGTNDADLLGSIVGGARTPDFGKYTPDDFSGKYNRETFCGALEDMFYRAKLLWPDAKIGFIVAQKMGTKANTVANRYAYFETAMQICEKWEIPYLNLWDDCELDPTLPGMYDPSKSDAENFYVDGQHLTAKGYDLTAEIIDKWLKTL